jgi:hypothetical protein
VVPQLQASLFLLRILDDMQDIVQIHAEEEQQTYSYDDRTPQRNHSS